VALAVLAQASIGIATLVWVVPIELALSHQAVALVVLTGATLHAARTLAKPPLGGAAKMREEPASSTCRVAMS
jgi:heme a synthase